MRTLTVKQPWASLLASGEKKYEFRSWKTNYRGLFLIHAGKTFDSKASTRYPNTSNKYPTGTIVALAKLVDCHEVNGEFIKNNINRNKKVYMSAPNDGYAFEIEIIKELNIPNINGKLSFWEYDISKDKL